MNGKINLDLKSLIFIFGRNKPYILPIVVILTCIILFFQFTIPQFKTFLRVREEAKDAEIKLELLKENLKVLVDTNEGSLDSQLSTLNLALPLSKDFSGILNAIYYASQKTGVNLGTFSFQIGDLSKSEKDDKFLTIDVSMPLNANVFAVNSFVRTISNTIPLSEVSLMKMGEKTATVNLSFYYKPLGPIDSKEDSRIYPPTQKGLLLINKLVSFENISSPILPQLISSPSGEKSNPF
ncbi:MAG: hypothetical protein HY424_01675 [Candidatus Levybacteria bacterium]|nr:hypothetical protein [Candidatus Levybacteria bacterium]